MPGTNRNDPCPCGSGKKYKKCCMFKDRPVAGPQELARAKLVPELIGFIARHYRQVMPEAYDVFWDGEHPEEVLSDEYRDFTDINFHEWLMFDFPVDPASGKTAVDLYLESGKNLSETEKVVLNLFQNSVISLYEVQEVVPEQGLVLKDLLLGGEYQIWEISATRSVVKWDILATRLLLIDGRYIMNGSVYPYAVKRKQELISAIKEEYDLFCEHAGARTWKEFLKAGANIFNRLWFAGTADRRPGIRTTTGEPLIFCRAAFLITDPANAAELLSKHDRLEPDDQGGFIWSEDPGRDGALVLGSIRIIKKELILECSSKKRLEQGKKLIIDTLAALVEHKTDTFKDPYEVLAAKQKRTKPAAELPLEIRQQVYDKFMREHMERWIDEKIPALDGRTPRECIATEAGRKRVVELLKSFENMEERKRKAGEPYHDYGWIWPKLGLERPE